MKVFNISALLLTAIFLFEGCSKVGLQTSNLIPSSSHVFASVPAASLSPSRCAKCNERPSVGYGKCSRRKLCVVECFNSELQRNYLGWWKWRSNYNKWHRAIAVSSNASVGTRVTGFTFTSLGNSNAGDVGVSGSKTSAPYRVDHNIFTNTAQSVFLVVGGNGTGLIDHNTFTGGGASKMIYNVAMGPSDARDGPGCYAGKFEHGDY